MNKKKLLIIAPYQFGELSDCYYWAKYAMQQGWDVTYLGYGYRHRAIKERHIDGVRLVRVMHRNNRLLHGICFIFSIILEILLHGHRNVIACRFPHVEILPRLFPKRNIVLDIRTLSVAQDEQSRNAADDALRGILHHFKTVSVISEGIGEKLGGNKPILPLGAEPLSETKKEFDTMRLFYIGTLINRNLPTFIEGLALFQQQDDRSVTFDIVGGGTEEEERRVKEAIERNDVNGVTMHGYLTHDEARSLFDSCNVGVCYVPVTDYYQHQPPTKLYEYILSGMACLATATISNKQAINETNGIVISDDAESVCKGLKDIYDRFPTYTSTEITMDAQHYHWKKIVAEDLTTLFQ